MCCRSVLKDTFGYNDQSSKTTVIQIFVQEITRKEILKLTPDMTKTINYNLNYLSSAHKHNRPDKNEGELFFIKKIHY